MIVLSIDSGHVRAVRSYQVRTFEVCVAQASNDDSEQIVFSSVPVEADRQTQQLRGALHSRRATPRPDFTILSDGADGPRSLGEAACIGPTCHVLDWFHLAMHIQHVARQAKAGPTLRTETGRTASDGGLGEPFGDQCQRSANLVGKPFLKKRDHHFCEHRGDLLRRLVDIDREHSMDHDRPPLPQ
jgi:hypothetical protein